MPEDVQQVARSVAMSGALGDPEWLRAEYDTAGGSAHSRAHQLAVSIPTDRAGPI